MFAAMFGQLLGSRLTRRVLTGVVAGALLLVAPTALRADTQVPQHERGFDPQKAFAFSDVDHVNLFNGGLTLTIPIGLSYPLDGGLSYALTLTYSSNVWEYDTLCEQGQQYCHYWGFAQPDDNAGFGWQLNLGRLIPPNTPRKNTSQLWMYVGPDGADHLFHFTLHHGETFTAGVSYTRDGSYLRMKEIGGGLREVELPDGTVQKFNSAGELLQIRTPHSNGTGGFYNTLTVTPVYSAGKLVRWDLLDSVGRIHKVYFVTELIDGLDMPRVTKVELAQFGTATPATYTFSYVSKTFNRPKMDPTLIDKTVSLKVLTGVTLPDGSAYTIASADYDIKGLLRGITLPTRGRLEWDYRQYTFPILEIPNKPPVDPADIDPYTRSDGVGTRRVEDAAGVVVGSWSYVQLLLTGGLSSRTTLTDPLGHKIDHFFQSDPNTTPYGMPYTTDFTDGAGRYLSTQVFKAGSATAVRSTYVRHEWDKVPFTGTLDPPYQRWDVNRRQASERIVYHDDANKYAEVTFSGFDGLGHYRTAATGGTFGASDVRTSTTNYNPARGTYLHLGTGTGHTFTMWPTSSPWILETYDSQTDVEAGVTAVRQICFESTTGFLQRERILKGTVAGANDVLRVYTRDVKGNRTREQHYGGDTQSLGTGALCTFALPASDQFRIDHTYQAGTLATSEWKTSGGAGLGFKHLDLTVDTNTGLASISRDTAGLATAYEYDAMGRLTWVKPPTGHDGWTEYVYTRATSSTALAKVNVNQRRNGSKTAAVLAQSSVLYDAFGRVWREKRRMPGAVWVTRETKYNGNGWVSSVSETESATAPTHVTQYLGYDPFGRATTIRPPDGSAHDVTFTYTGVRVTERREKIGTGRNATTGAITETTVETREISDRQGRLWRVWENDTAAGGAAVMTEYLYDVGNRLKQVKMTRGTVTQNRYFTYDKRGFLTSETHPEKGLSGNGAVTYQSYNSSGLPSRRIDGPQDHTFTYDRAGRITQIRETGGSVRVLETRTYGTGKGASNLSAGKLLTSTRNNYHERWGVNFPVVRTYTYGGRQGRPSQLLYTVNTIDSYTMSFLWTELGHMSSLTYPTCNHCPVGTVPARTVTTAFSEGLVTSMSGWATSVTYHPNGLVNQITHANGVVSTQANDPNQMRRPGSIKVTKGTTTLFDTGAYGYDGAGNVVKMGTDYYLYDTYGRLKEGTAFQTGSSLRQTYGYDGFGNLTAITTWVGTTATPRTNDTSPTTNRLSQVAYDAAGNQTTWGLYTYTWDPTGALKAYQGSGNDWAYAYDADGERMLIYNASNGSSVFRIRGLDNKPLREVRYSGGVWSWGKDWIYRDGSLLATVAPGASGVRYAHADHLGSPRLFTDASGVAQERYHYYPFGEQAGSAPAIPEAMRFTGHERDPAGTGTTDDLDYMHARYCNPQLGRFLATDPKELRQTTNSSIRWNRYGYSANNPLKFLDPDGRDIMLFVRDDSGGGMTNFGHVALRVYGNGYDKTYDFGRYRGGRGFLRAKGPGILRVWTKFDSFKAGQKAKGKPRAVNFTTTKPKINRQCSSFKQRSFKRRVSQIILKQDMWNSSLSRTTT